MATFEPAAFRDLSIPPFNRAVVAGGHRPGSAPFHLTLAGASRPSASRAPASDQWSRIHNCVGNRLWSHSGYCARFWSRMPHRRLQNTHTDHDACPNHQSSATSFCNCTDFDALAWLRFRIKTRHDNPYRFFPCNCQYACGLSRDVEVMGTDISNIAPETLATILVCSVAPRDPLCTLRSSSGSISCANRRGCG